MLVNNKTRRPPIPPPLSFNPSTQSTKILLTRTNAYTTRPRYVFCLINCLRFMLEQDGHRGGDAIHNVPGCGYYFRIFPLFIRMPTTANGVDHHRPKIHLTTPSHPDPQKNSSAFRIFSTFHRLYLPCLFTNLKKSKRFWKLGKFPSKCFHKP